ncbi:polyhydroxyalkanoate synthesis regulator DNA-binding domain-containing protein [Bythopirellula polymerisocia]|uniref:PHB/PHA accumulation regulator DNA-binding domain protein n=1 Tax=Bythopirellula polymerisocia TaxID=2528003 RepID=A0A5C6CXT7_9BACT|nr:polyhydroxyalkanoate synthesis regulator DNA-binding domain-containing protein [Bythopirellula polymerisocia]TWU29773.1 PHB/PHA accumulation regulator DNA-binding domain protein [Bythopirellula polymerisocia]
MPDEVIQIKRYPNRRFYSRNDSKYVSLQDIEKLIREGNTIEISDSQSGESLTRSVLAQIILDRQPENIALFPVDMLHSIVRSNEMVTEFLRDYFQHSLTYLDYLQRHSASAKDLVNPMHWAKAWMDGFKPANGSPQKPRDEKAQLAERIEELEDRIKQLESKENLDV